MTMPKGLFTMKSCVFRRFLLIKLDLVNDVVNRTGITKTKAEIAVETVFESMKKSLARESGSSCAGLAFLTSSLAKPELEEIRARAPKLTSFPARPSALSQGKNFSRFPEPAGSATDHQHWLSLCQYRCFPVEVI